MTDLEDQRGTGVGSRQECRQLELAGDRLGDAQQRSLLLEAREERPDRLTVAHGLSLGARHSSGAIMIMTRHWSGAPPA